MLCPKCQFENPEDSNFCLECGHKLEQKCSQCKKALPIGAKFCNGCGHKLAAKSPPSQPEYSLEEKFRKIQRYLPKGLAEKIRPEATRHQALDIALRRTQSNRCDQIRTRSHSARRAPYGECSRRVWQPLVGFLSLLAKTTARRKHRQTR
mgnify:CR=1 FL=1